MKTRTVLWLVAVLVAAVLPLTVGARALDAKPQETCPVMGGTIDKSVFVDHEGERVYFCCPGCIDAFKAEPAKFLAKLEAEGVELEKAPADGAAAGHACGPDCTCPKCEGKAKGTCKGDCKGGCKGGCKGDCQGGCKGDCQGGCKGGAHEDHACGPDCGCHGK